jgi:predicted acyltransferase
MKGDPGDYTGAVVETRTNTGPVAASRLTSLDVFRGLTMASMVIVNNPGDWGSVYWPLLHAEWHGLTPTDLIFPFFLFIVGVSITLSRRSAGWGSIIRRAAIIFALGLFLNGYPRFDLPTWRIPGVLQRIAICYLIGAAAFKLTAGDRRRQAVLLGGLGCALTLAYYAIMMFIAPPGGAAGDLTPEGNLGAHIDRALFGRHTWRPNWDPEGLLSTVPSIATTLFGIVCGLLLTPVAQGFSPATRVAPTGRLAAFGIVCLAVGLAWHPLFPVNKNLWTSSFTLVTAGAAGLLLALCYWTIDVKGWRWWTKPFVILGANAITLYVLSGILADTLGLLTIVQADGTSISLGRHLYLHYFLPLTSPKSASLLYACANLVLLFLPLAWMYRRRLFVRV